MKNFINFIIFGSLVLFTSIAWSNFSEEANERTVVVTIGSALIPSGFSADSDVFAVISGVFSNSCYAWQEAQVNHNFKDSLHEIKALARVQQGPCLMVLVPFSQEVHVGKLGHGKHTLRFANGDGTYMDKTVELE